MSKTRRLYFRLSGVSLEINTLEEHLELIEEQIGRSTRLATCELDSKREELRNDVTADEYDWDMLYLRHRCYVEVTVPRVLRNPFLISLFAVYESSVTTIAELIQEDKGQKLSLDDIRRNDFLERAKRYYRHILQFELSTDNERWKRLKELSDLRHAIAHANGRFEAISEGLRRRIVQQGFLSEDTGFVIVPGPWLRETVKLVKEDLEDLLARYEEWETARSPDKK